MLVLKFRHGNKITLTVPASPVPTRIVVSHEGGPRIGFIAPREVAIVRSDAKQTVPAGK